MVKVLELSCITIMEPEGVIVPFAEAVATIVYVLNKVLNVSIAPQTVSS